MDRKTLLAIALCFLIFLGWQKYYIEPRTHHASAPQSMQTAMPTAGAPQGSASKSEALTVAKAQRPAENRPEALSIGTATIGDGSKFFSDWTLKAYRVKLEKEAAAVDLRNVTHQTGEVELGFDLPGLSYLSQVQGSFSKGPQGPIWSYEDQNVKLQREYVIDPNKPFIDMKLTAEFKGGTKPNFATLSVTSSSPTDDPEARDRQLLYWTNNSIERVHVEKKLEGKDLITPVKWVAAGSRYFILTLVASGPLETKGRIEKLSEDTARIGLVYPVTSNTITVPVRAYFGPKELDLLREVEPSLDTTVDFGMFTIVAYPLLKIMKFFYSLFANYGVAIILLTLLVKLATYPLNYKSFKNMKKMAVLQPELQKLREKYKDDKEALNREMLTFMKTRGFNPMAGCFPMLIQMPIFFALYQVLYSAIELYQAPFAFWIHDLSAKDPLFVTPILTTLVMYVQQKMTPTTATDPAQQRMMQFMPLMFGIFLLTVPSGLTLYMFVNAASSILQQWFINKKLGGAHVAAAPVRAR